MASTCRGSCDSFFLRPSAPSKDLSSEPFAAVCREDSVLPAHNCSVWNILFGRPQGACPCAKSQPDDGNLVVEDDIEEGTVHMDATVVVQEAELPELIHEETDP